MTTFSLQKKEQSFVNFTHHLLTAAFTLLFVLVAVKKFRMGMFAYADSLLVVTGDKATLTAKEIPKFLLYSYGVALPFLELFAGLGLLWSKTRERAIQVIAFIYITFVFGQMYNLNTSKIGTEYLPSLMALCLYYWSYLKRESLNAS